MKRTLLLGTVTLVLAVMALSTSAALAGPGPGSSVAARGANAGFSCERAAERLARVQNRVAKIEARIGNGEAKRPRLAARIAQWLEKRASRIEARIAAHC